MILGGQAHHLAAAEVADADHERGGLHLRGEASRPSLKMSVPWALKLQRPAPSAATLDSRRATSWATSPERVGEVGVDVREAAARALAPDRDRLEEVEELPEPSVKAARGTPKREGQGSRVGARPGDERSQVGPQERAPPGREHGEGRLLRLPVCLREHVVGVAVVEGERVDVEAAVAQRVDLSLDEGVRQAGIEGGQVGEADLGLRACAVAGAHRLARPRSRIVASIADE